MCLAKFPSLPALIAANSFDRRDLVHPRNPRHELARYLGHEVGIEAADGQELAHGARACGAWRKGQPSLEHRGRECREWATSQGAQASRDVSEESRAN